MVLYINWSQTRSLLMESSCGVVMMMVMTTVVMTTVVMMMVMPVLHMRKPLV